VRPSALANQLTGAAWEESEDEFLSRVLTHTDRRVLAAQTERFVKLRIESDKPVALTISSDWHLTTTGATDVRGLLAYADATATAEGVYALLVGDQLDNPIKHKPANPAQIPDDIRLLDVVLARFRGKVLGMTSGNHDDWTKSLAGVDVLATMARQHRIHYAPDELIYVVQIVKPGTDTVTQQYVIATRHKYRRNSTLNGLHAPARWLEESINDWPHDPATGATFLPDVVAIGDNHIAQVGTEATPRGRVVLARMGAWQIGSSYARSFGFKRYEPTAPTVLLHPTKRKLVAHDDYAVAFDHLARIRKGKR